MSVLLCDSISKNNKVYNFTFNFLNNNIYAILGKANSNKEDLLSLLAGDLSYDSGKIWVDGYELNTKKATKKRICYIKKTITFLNNNKITNILSHYNRKYPKWDNYYAYYLCDHFKINTNARWNALKDFQKHLLIAICSLSSRANITIFDDSLYDVDMKYRYEFFKLLREHYEKYPRTFIISTDRIDDIKFMLDKILFFDKGKLIDYFDNNNFENFKLLTGKIDILPQLLSDLKIIGKEERGDTLSVCVYKNLTKDDRRKFQKYFVEVSDCPIEKLFLFLTDLREQKEKKIKLY